MPGFDDDDVDTVGFPSTTNSEVVVVVVVVGVSLLAGRRALTGLTFDSGCCSLAFGSCSSLRVGAVEGGGLSTMMTSPLLLVDVRAAEEISSADCAVVVDWDDETGGGSGEHDFGVFSTVLAFSWRPSILRGRGTDT